MIVFPDIDNDFLASLYLCLIFKTKAVVDLLDDVLFEWSFSAVTVPKLRWDAETNRNLCTEPVTVRCMLSRCTHSALVL